MHRTATGLAVFVLAAHALTARAQWHPNIIDCDPEQTMAVSDMIDFAERAIQDARADLENVARGGDSSRFDYWFGAHTPPILDYVRTAFDRMATAIHEVRFSCECVLPHVVASATFGRRDAPVHLCDPVFEEDFREFGAGSLIHELSHVVGSATSEILQCPDGAPRESRDWPDAIHDKVLEDPSENPNAPYFGHWAAEPYRLYALGWHPNQQSSVDCGFWFDL